jgi:multicomponent Na+:H+ antiporter subunit G
VNDWITAIILILSAPFMLLAAIGMIRMPDLYTRMSVATKAATLGAGGLLLAVAVNFGDLAHTTRALLAITFLFLTQPVAAHMISRAGYFHGVPLWEHSVIDELSGAYDPVTHELSSKPIEGKTHIKSLNDTPEV